MKDNETLAMELAGALRSKPHTEEEAVEMILETLNQVADDKARSSAG